MLNGFAGREEAKHPHTASWVAEVLRSRIAAGLLLPGTKLAEQALAKAFCVSRNTLREAFTVLAGESIVTRIPNHGVVVTFPGARGVREIYQARRFVEPAAVRWAKGIDVAKLQEIVLVAVAASTRSDVLEMADANQKFHETLLRGTNSGLLQDFMERVLAQMRLVFHAMSHAPDFHSNYVEHNASIVKMLVDGQREEAAEALLRYMDQAEAELLAHLSADKDMARILAKAVMSQYNDESSFPRHQPIGEPQVS